MVAMIAIVMRHTFGLGNLVTDEHLDLLGKVLLACGLMTAYGYVFEVFDALYSGEPHEIQTLADRFAGAYAWTYWGAVVFNFIPLQALWWRVVRRTGWMLLLISVAVVVGMWLERYMILVTSLYRDFLVSSWSHFTPSFWDWSTYFGTIGLFLVPFLIAIRLVPMISIFESKELLHEEKEEQQHG
jgi:molybdopterin-containing oxidoreductase family membrane subunit